ncbi:MAG: alpha/beta fold hydrolase [Candidatus Hydrogenedentes bacterium]|nr:alpha/beta fold hydrolase [Candidatus Hydrogenedentota bacterium]
MKNFNRGALLAFVVLALLAASFGAVPGAWAAGEETDVAGYPKIVKRAVEIWSDGTRLSADIFYPKDRKEGEKLPTIVLCHGWGGTKASLVRAIAPRFASEGYVVLAFDYRGWGDSDSRLVLRGKMPEADEDGYMTVKVQAIREVVDPVDHQMDIDNAISFVEGESMVDTERIGIWGSSFGGGHVIWRAAHDDRVACVVAQVGGMNGTALNKLNDALSETRTARARGEIDPVPQGIAVPGGELRGTAFMERVVLYSPGYYADQVTVPTFLLDADKEHYFDITANSEAVHKILKKNGVETEYHVLKDTAHYDVYRGDTLDEVMKLEIAWFDKHLKN